MPEAILVNIFIDDLKKVVNRGLWAMLSSFG